MQPTPRAILMFTLGLPVALLPVLWFVFGDLGVSIEASDKVFTPMSLFWCGVAGLVITGLIIVITEYYTGTDRRPVNSIAEASVTGHGTNVIQGLAVSLESTALPALVIIAGIIVTYNLAGLFGIAFAVATMLALAGMVVALDAFGPVTDNAGGIAEMAGLAQEHGHEILRGQHSREEGPVLGFDGDVVKLSHLQRRGRFT